MVRSNLEIPNVPDGWPDGPPGPDDMLERSPAVTTSETPNDPQAVVRMASTLDYDGASHKLTLTRGDGTVQQFPTANNPDSHSGGRWPNGTFDYQRHTTHNNGDDTPRGKYGPNGNYQFDVPGRPDMGVHSGRMDVPDGLGRKGVEHATNGCIRTTDDGTAAIHQAMTSGDPVTRITVRNNH